jgi:hypothetical protein
VKIRNFQPGDEALQVGIYNEAAADLPKFKPATAEEVIRRTRARDFDPGTRFCAETEGKPVGYATFSANGRVSYPWCCKGQESAAEPLFQSVLAAMAGRGMKKAFAAYRADWPAPREFFLSHGFQLAREMINFILDPADMPTRPGRRGNPLTPLRREDVPDILAMAPHVLRVSTAAELERHLFNNPYFNAEDLFVLRNRGDDKPTAVGILIAKLTYADPSQIDASMPCFRLGAFGSEGMTTKRVNGLFSFLTQDNRDASPLGLDLMGHASFTFEESGGGSLAGQVPSDAPHLLRFYHSYFRRQGSFPVFERTL